MCFFFYKTQEVVTQDCLYFAESFCGEQTTSRCSAGGKQIGWFAEKVRCVRCVVQTWF